MSVTVSSIMIHVWATSAAGTYVTDLRTPSSPDQEDGTRVLAELTISRVTDNIATYTMDTNY